VGLNHSYDLKHLLHEFKKASPEFDKPSKFNVVRVLDFLLNQLTTELADSDLVYKFNNLLPSEKAQGAAELYKSSTLSKLICFKFINYKSCPFNHDHSKTLHHLYWKLKPAPSLAKSLFNFYQEHNHTYECIECGVADREGSHTTHTWKILELPKVMIFVIDRFDKSIDKNAKKSRSKSANLSGFQHTLNLSPFTSGIHPKDTIYEAFAAICSHQKSLKFAHYSALIRMKGGKSWMKIQHSKKREIEDTSTYVPHVVFYRKVDVEKVDLVVDTDGEVEITIK